MMALFPPSSSSTLPKAFLDIKRNAFAHGAGTGGGNEGDAFVVGHRFADGDAITDGQAENGGINVIGAADFFRDFDGGDGGERRLVGWFPNGGIAADGCQGAVPRPHRDGEIEGGDDADDAERMPRFHHAMLRAFGGDGEAVELARETNGEITNINHLLHFTLAFGDDFAGFEADEGSEFHLGLAQGVAELADEFAAFGGGDSLPELEGVLGFGHGVRNPHRWRCGHWR